MTGKGGISTAFASTIVIVFRVTKCNSLFQVVAGSPTWCSSFHFSIGVQVLGTRQQQLMAQWVNTTLHLYMGREYMGREGREGRRGGRGGRGGRGCAN